MRRIVHGRARIIRIPDAAHIGVPLEAVEIDAQQFERACQRQPAGPRAHDAGFVVYRHSSLP